MHLCCVLCVCVCLLCVAVWCVHVGLHTNTRACTQACKRARTHRRRALGAANVHGSADQRRGPVVVHQSAQHHPAGHLQAGPQGCGGHGPSHLCRLHGAGVTPLLWQWWRVVPAVLPQFHPKISLGLGTLQRKYLLIFAQTYMHKCKCEVVFFVCEVLQCFVCALVLFSHWVFGIGCV